MTPSDSVAFIDGTTITVPVWARTRNVCRRAARRLVELFLKHVAYFLPLSDSS